MLDPEVIIGLARSARNYRRGLFCPAELWHQFALRLVGLDTAQLLAALPADLQEVLRDCYRERALSLQSKAIDDEVYRGIERWCRQADA
jgi:hypothetical protein